MMAQRQSHDISTVIGATGLAAWLPSHSSVARLFANKMVGQGCANMDNMINPVTNMDSVGG